MVTVRRTNELTQKKPKTHQKPDDVNQFLSVSLNKSITFKGVNWEYDMNSHCNKTKNVIRIS